MMKPGANKGKRISLPNQSRAMVWVIPTQRDA
jgi:hypothetical protein